MDNKTQELLADRFAKKYEDYNTKVLKQLAETIRRFKGLSYGEANKLAQQLKYNKSYTDMIDELSKLSGESEKEIKKVLEETVKEHIDFADTFYKAKNLDTPIYENSKTLQNIVTSNLNVAGDDFSNIARSTGFAFQDKNNHIKFLNMKDTYYKVIDDSVFAINSGQETFDTMMRSTINQLAESGVRRIIYTNDGKAQYTQRLDTAVRRNLLDSIRQVSNEAELEFGKEYGADGVEITVHENPAPDHAMIQGRQFKKSEYAKLQAGKVAKDFKGNTYQIKHSKKGFYRQISQYNCHHTINNILLGISEPLYSDEELEEINKRNETPIEIDGKNYTKYEVTQLQRKLETEIRKSKDKHIMFKESDDKIGMLKEQKRITQLTRKYKEISKKANIPEQLDRARVSGYKRVSVKNLEIPKENKQTDYKDYFKNYYNKSEDDFFDRVIEIGEKFNKEYKPLYSKMDNETKQAFSNYSGLYYKDINNTLLNKPLDDTDNYTGVKGVHNIKEYKEKINNWVNLMDKEIEKTSIDENTVLWKGTLGKYYNDLKPGDEFKLDIFNSTSLNRGIAESFTWNKENAIVMKINSPKGTKGIFITDEIGLEGELEVLLARNQKYKFIKEYEDYGVSSLFKDKNKKIKIIEVEAIK